MDEEMTPWDALGITEDDYNYAMKKVQHAEIEAKDLAELVKMVFPDNKIQQAMAYAIHMVASDWADDEEEMDEDMDD